MGNNGSLHTDSKEFADMWIFPWLNYMGGGSEFPDQLGKAPPQTSIWHNSAGLHPTRHLAWHRGLIFCCTCGCHGFGGVVRLTQQCQIRPPNAVQTARLGRLLQGKVPTQNLRRPEPEGATYPAGLAMPRRLNHVCGECSKYGYGHYTSCRQLVGHE